MKKDNAYFGIIFGLAAVSAIAYLTWLRTQSVADSIAPYESGLGSFTCKDAGTDTDILLPSPLELQEGLIKQGYDIGTDGADGIIGPNTIAGWERYVCDQHAKKYFGM